MASGLGSGCAQRPGALAAGGLDGEALMREADSSYKSNALQTLSLKLRISKEIHHGREDTPRCSGNHPSHPRAQAEKRGRCTPWRRRRTLAGAGRGHCCVGDHTQEPVVSVAHRRLAGGFGARGEGGHGSRWPEQADAVHAAGPPHQITRRFAEAAPMGWIQEAGRGIKERVLNTPGLRVLVLAIRNYILHQSANQAGSLAFSSVLAMFPLLILLSASAGYIGKPGDAAQLASRVMEYAPQLVREVMQPVIDQVLAQRNQALLAIGVVVTLWTASSGMQAIRSALNRAYGIERGLAFWKARIKVTLFTVIVGSAILVAFSSVVILPYVWQVLADNVGDGPDVHWVRHAVRYALAYLVLVALYALMYGWLPDIRQRIYTVLPGALVGAAMWVGAAAALSYTLRTAGKLALLYGSFAGVVATLVFLYISATTLIFGAEINGVLRNRLEERKKESPAEAQPD
ncbi:hypothetical protein CAP37_10915 [Hydrogenophaga sp. IBVHS1]|nr:hypothetical protein CAP37_10915 [Hydrogenophaga sp. IBVHS1]